MITKITGTVRQVREEGVILGVGAFDYEILVPDLVRRQLQSQLGQEVSLFTIQYLEGNPMQGRLTPRLIGFLNEIEREFFDLFCSVDGLGVKKALRAQVRPVREIAEAIERQDDTALSALPGIGAALAERIIAKLRRKVPKFALMVARPLAEETTVEKSLLDEAFEVLVAVGHSSADARKLLESLAGGKKKYKDIQEVLAAVYAQTQGQ